jgi:endoglucanase
MKRKRRVGRTHRWLAIVRDFLSRPVAPLREEAPARFIERFAASRRALAARRDEAGNIHVSYPRSARQTRAPLVVVAHMDHPGFWIGESRDGVARLSFQGGVGLAHVRPGQAVRFFERGGMKATGRGRLLKCRGRKGRLRAATALIASGRAPTGGIAMWDFPACRIRGNGIVARNCDDGLGSAALLCLLDELSRRRPRCAGVSAVFTRAEELGFYGAFAAARRGIPRRARVISVECSRSLPDAPQGDGVVLRVGDRLSTFDPEFTAAVHQVCEQLARRDKSFRYQRRLMHGGTCEASVFAARGFSATALAVPLANYHNQTGLDGGRPGLGPERVAVPDFLSLVRLLVELALTRRPWPALARASRARLAEVARRARRELRLHPLQP